MQALNRAQHWVEHGAFWKVGFLVSEIPMRFYTASAAFENLERPIKAEHQTFMQASSTICTESKATIRHLRKQTFLNDRLWKVATGRNGR